MSFWVGFEEILHLYVDFLGKFYGTFVNQSKLSAIGLYAKDFFEIVGAPWSEICVCVQSCVRQEAGYCSIAWKADTADTKTFDVNIFLF